MPKRNRRNTRNRHSKPTKTVTKPTIKLDLNPKQAEEFIYELFRMLIGLSGYHKTELRPSLREKGITARKDRLESSRSMLEGKVFSESTWVKHSLSDWNRFNSQKQELTSRKLFIATKQVYDTAIKTLVAHPDIPEDMKEIFKIYALYGDFVEVEFETSRDKLSFKQIKSLMLRLCDLYARALEFPKYIYESIVMFNLDLFIDGPLVKNVIKDSKKLAALDENRKALNEYMQTHMREMSIFKDREAQEFNIEDEIVKNYFSIAQSEPETLINILAGNWLSINKEFTVNRVIFLSCCLTALNQIHLSKDKPFTNAMFVELYDNYINKLYEALNHEGMMDSINTIMAEYGAELSHEEKFQRNRNKQLLMPVLITLFNAYQHYGELAASNPEMARENLYTLVMMMRHFPKHGNSDAALVNQLLSEIDILDKKNALINAKLKARKDKEVPALSPACDENIEKAEQNAHQLMLEEAALKKERELHKQQKESKQKKPTKKSPRKHLTKNKMSRTYVRKRFDKKVEEETSSVHPEFQAVKYEIANKQYDKVKALCDEGYLKYQESDPLMAAKFQCYYANCLLNYAFKNLSLTRQRSMSMEDKKEYYHKAFTNYEQALEKMDLALNLIKSSSDKHRQLQHDIVTMIDMVEYNLVTAQNSYKRNVEIEKRKIEQALRKQAFELKLKKHKQFNLGMRLIKKEFKAEELKEYQSLFAKKKGFNRLIRNFCQRYEISCDLETLLDYLQEKHVDGAALIAADVHACVMALGVFLWKNNPRHRANNRNKSRIHRFFVENHSKPTRSHLSSEDIEHQLIKLWNNIKSIKEGLQERSVEASVAAVMPMTFWQRLPESGNRRSSITLGPGIAAYAESLDYIPLSYSQ